MHFKDVYETKKLDEAQAEANHEIATDPGRHEEPPTMRFNPFAICKKCRIPWINYNGYDIIITCTWMGMHGRNIKRIEYCDENKKVTKVMRKYYD